MDQEDPPCTVDSILRETAELTQEDVDLLEKQLQQNPGHLPSRLKLLGKYWRREELADETERALRIHHIEWLVLNHPEHCIAGSPLVSVHREIDECGYAIVHAAWLAQTEAEGGKKVSVLANASRFFSICNPDLAESMLLAAINLEPENLSLRKRLAHLYLLMSGKERQAFEELDRLQGDFYELTELPVAAYKAEKLEQALLASNKLLEMAAENRSNWNYGNAINKAHTVLGLVALKAGDFESAKRHLKLSSIDIASSQTKSFGPALELAEELLNAGGTESVLSYLDEFERLSGVGNMRELELRYKASTGETADYLSPRYQEFVRTHQIQVLASRTVVERRKHLEHLIELIEMEIAIWRTALDEPGTDAEERQHFERLLPGLLLHRTALEALRSE